MVSLEGFDADKVDTTGLDALPAGKYVMAIVSSEKKDASTGNGWYMALKLQVLDGEYKGRVAFANLNLGNNNSTAKEIAKIDLAKICNATGVKKPNDSSQLHNIPILVTLKCSKHQDKLKNDVADYAKVGSEPVEAVAATETSDTPW